MRLCFVVYVGTFHEISPIDDFMNKVLPRFLHYKSKTTTFSMEPTISINTWQGAQVLIRDRWLDYLVEDEADEGVFYMLSEEARKHVKGSGGDLMEEAKKLVATYISCIANPSRVDDFDALMVVSTCAYALRALDDSYGPHIHYSCSCIMFANNACCKHALAMSIQQRLTVVPADRCLRAIGVAKCVGRPKKCGPALQRDDARRPPSQYYTQYASQGNGELAEPVFDEDEEAEMSTPELPAAKRGRGRPRGSGRAGGGGGAAVELPCTKGSGRGRGRPKGSGRGRGRPRGSAR